MLNRMRIGTMLTLGYGLLVLLMALMVATTHLRVSSFAASVAEIQDDIYPNTTAAANIRFNVVRNWANTQTLNTVSNKEAVKLINEEMAANSKVISDNFDFLKQHYHTEEGSKLVAAALLARESYTGNRKEFIELLKDEDKDPARMFLMGPLRNSMNDYLDSIGRIFSSLSTRLEKETSASASAATQTRAINLVIGLVALAVAIGSAVFMVRTVSGQLGGEVFEASHIAREIAAGNLAIDIALRAGDTSSLLASLATMREKLRTMAGDIQRGATRVTETAHKVARVAADVASASARQSDAAGSAAAAVEQLTVSIDHLSHNAEEAHSFSQRAAELSAKGETVIRSAGAEMDKIAHSVQSSSEIIAELEQRSNEISAVVNVIKEIADQTNLLALNAAIEAARAGEQGRGFAVVADEVRKLAERTSNSTQEIAVTVGKIQQGTQAAVQSMLGGVDQVKAGTEMAELAGQSIGEIHSGSARVVDDVNDISSALKQQSAASNDIARSIEQIAQMVSANNVAAEDVAAAASAMEHLADELSASVRFFRL